MVALSVCERFALSPSAVRAELGLPPLGVRRGAAWTYALSHIAAIEAAYEAGREKDGKPTVEQVQLIMGIQRDYIAREGLDLVVEESDGPVLTPTDEGYVAPDGEGDDAAVFGLEV